MEAPADGKRHKMLRHTTAQNWLWRCTACALYATLVLAALYVWSAGESTNGAAPSFALVDDEAAK